MSNERRFNICGNCVRWWCNDPQELTGFCQLTFNSTNYEEHGDCKDYKDKFGRDET